MHRICVLPGFYAPQVGSCYQSTLPKIPEERRFNLQRGAAMKAHKTHRIYTVGTVDTVGTVIE